MGILLVQRTYNTIRTEALRNGALRRIQSLVPKQGGQQIAKARQQRQ